MEATLDTEVDKACLMVPIFLQNQKKITIQQYTKKAVQTTVKIN